MKLIEDALNETSYLADVAGLHAYVYPVMYRLSIKVDGFNDKLPKLLERICQEVVGHQVREDRFQPVREEMVRSFKNRHMKPTRHANYLRQRALRPMLWPLHDQLAVLETCTMHVRASRLSASSPILAPSSPPSERHASPATLPQTACLTIGCRARCG
jgi:insulysin